MLTFIEATDFSLLIEHICKVEQFNFFKYLIDSKIEVQKHNPENLSDLVGLTQVEEDLFGENHLRPILVDLKNISIDEQILYVFTKLQAISTNYYFYTTEDKKLTADQKKLLKKVEVNYLNLKSFDKNLGNQLVSQYLEFYGIAENISGLQKLVNQCLSYQELIDTLDFIFLAESPKLALESVLKEEQLPIFMYGFSTSNLKKDVDRWRQRLHPDDLQLHLSLLLTKLDKQKNDRSKILQKELILTDQRIKTISKVAPEIWLKYWFYQAVSI